MKYFFTAIILITFYLASAQNNTSGTFYSPGDSLLYTDVKPVYSKWVKYFILDKIEYTKEEMILFVHYALKFDGVKYITIFGKKGRMPWHLLIILSYQNKSIEMRFVKNIRKDGKLLYAEIPNDDSLNIKINSGEKVTCEIHFNKRLPKNTKYVSLIEGVGYDEFEGHFNCYNIEVSKDIDDNSYMNKNKVNYKKTNSTSPIKEKDLLNKMELNKPLTLNNIYFETGKSNLLDSSFAELNTLFNILKSKTKMIIQISGYTDNVGKTQDNLVLSEARANAVKKYLSDKGIDNKRIITKGYGSSNPKVSNDTAEGRAQNRRVEIMVLKNG